MTGVFDERIDDAGFEGIGLFRGCDDVAHQARERAGGTEISGFGLADAVPEYAVRNAAHVLTQVRVGYGALHTDPGIDEHEAGDARVGLGVEKGGGGAFAQAPERHFAEAGHGVLKGFDGSGEVAAGFFHGDYGAFAIAAAAEIEAEDGDTAGDAISGEQDGGAVTADASDDDQAALAICGRAMQHAV